MTPTPLSLQATQPPATRRAAGVGTGVLVPLLALVGATALTLGLETRLLPAWIVLALGSVLLVAFLTIEIGGLRRQMPAGAAWAISPVVVASAYTFIGAFGLTNVLFWTSDYGLTHPYARTLEPEWLARASLYGVVAAAAMWAGFHSWLGVGLGRALWRSTWLARVIRTSPDIRWVSFWACVVLSLAARVTKVRLGFYGVLGDAEALGGTFRQLLNYGDDLGLVALIGLSSAVFSRPVAPTALRALLLGLLVNECLWGALAADKTNTVLPVVVAGLAYYWYRREIPLQFVGLGALLLAGSFLVFMPLRRAALNGTDVDVRSVSALTDAVFGTASTELLRGTAKEGASADLGSAILERINETEIAAIALRYHENNPDDPIPKTLARDILFTPAYTLVPRAVWPSKPRSQNVGKWFYQGVLGGKSETTLAGPTMIGYLNFAGGFLAVVLGFALIGVLQRGAHDRLFPVASGGALLVLLGLLGTLGQLPSQFIYVVALPFRLVPVLLVVQYVIFRPEPSFRPAPEP